MSHSADPRAIRSRPGLDAAVSVLSAAGLPTADLTERHCQDFFYLGPTQAPTGLVGLEIFDDVALLRSLVVAGSSRGSGEGTRLLAHAEEAARARGVKRVYLLTTTAEGFFLKRGYQYASRDSAPVAIRATPEFSGICPASSSFLFKPL
jgi:amino-acid N-acetyltransferase